MLNDEDENNKTLIETQNKNLHTKTIDTQNKKTLPTNKIIKCKKIGNYVLSKITF